MQLTNQKRVGNVYKPNTKMEVKKDKKLLEKTWLVLIQFSGNSTFSTLRKNYYFPSLAFLSYSCYFGYFG